MKITALLHVTGKPFAANSLHWSQLHSFSPKPSHSSTRAANMPRQLKPGTCCWKAPASRSCMWLNCSCNAAGNTFKSTRQILFADRLCVVRGDGRTWYQPRAGLRQAFRPSGLHQTAVIPGEGEESGEDETAVGQCWAAAKNLMDTPQMRKTE